jgi:hypothetical protein
LRRYVDDQPLDIFDQVEPRQQQMEWRIYVGCNLVRPLERLDPLWYSRLPVATSGMVGLVELFAPANDSALGCSLG